MDLLTAMRAHLVAEEIGRMPREPADLPPIWLEPQFGVPAPGERPKGGSANEVGADAVIALYQLPGVAPRPYESELRNDYVQVRIRTAKSPTAHQLEINLRAALEDRFNWDMADLRVIHSRLYRGLQPLGADAQGFDWSMEFSFDVYAPVAA